MDYKSIIFLKNRKYCFEIVLEIKKKVNVFLFINKLIWNSAGDKNIFLFIDKYKEKD